MIRITAVAHLIIDTASDTVRFFLQHGKEKLFLAGLVRGKWFYGVFQSKHTSDFIYEIIFWTAWNV